MEDDKGVVASMIRASMEKTPHLMNELGLEKFQEMSQELGEVVVKMQEVLRSQQKTILLDIGAKNLDNPVLAEEIVSYINSSIAIAATFAVITAPQKLRPALLMVITQTCMLF